MLNNTSFFIMAVALFLIGVYIVGINYFAKDNTQTNTAHSSLLSSKEGLLTMNIIADKQIVKKIYFDKFAQ